MPSKVLIVGPAWIGDMVMAQSLCKTLRQRDPELTIDMYAPGWSLPVVRRMPEVGAALESPFRHGEFDWRARRREGRRLREREYDRAIVLPRSFKSALVPWHAGIPVRTGFRGEMRFGLLNDIRRLDPVTLPRTVDRYVALGLERGAHPDAVPHPGLSVDRENQRALRESLALHDPARVVGLLPGAEYGPAKQWPATSFRELAAALTRAGIGVWIFGSDAERPLGDSIAAGADGAVNLCGRTSLADAIDLIALCSDVVTNDSGLMHIAAATGVRVVAIYGSSSPHYTPPLTDDATIVWLQLSCSPCFDRECRYGHYRCLREIDASDVARLLQ